LRQAQLELVLYALRDDIEVRIIKAVALPEHSTALATYHRIRADANFSQAIDKG
jgi:hypothetical protein